MFGACVNLTIKSSFTNTQNKRKTRYNFGFLNDDHLNIAKKKKKKKFQFTFNNKLIENYNESVRNKLPSHSKFELCKFFLLFFLFSYFSVNLSSSSEEQRNNALSCSLYYYGYSVIIFIKNFKKKIKEFINWTLL